MEGLKLSGQRENETIQRQVGRGRGEQNPFESGAFRQANTISLDISYVFDSPGKSSISRKDFILETLQGLWSFIFMQFFESIESF